MGFVAKRYGWRFFLKPEGLELFFLNTWNLSLLSFFLFFVLNFQIKCSCLIGFNLKDWELNWKMFVFGSVSIFCRWMIDCEKKEGVLYPSEKLILFLLLFDFWGCLIVLWKESFQFNWNVVLKMESIFKKQCIKLPSAMVQ